MVRNKISIGTVDSDGNPLHLKLEGNITRERLFKLLDSMGIMDVEQESQPQNLDSIGGKIWNIINKFYLIGKFTSTDLLEKYEDEYNEPIKLSVISTYLSRFNEKGRVNRVKSGREWTYQITKTGQKPHLTNYNPSNN